MLSALSVLCINATNFNNVLLKKDKVNLINNISYTNKAYRKLPFFSDLSKEIIKEMFDELKLIKSESIFYFENMANNVKFIEDL